MTADEILKQYFGYDSFRTGQESIINAILSHNDCLTIMPTGAGKSICYQVPAMVMDGITLVISPLISLMQDQVKALNEVGINAAYLNSSLTYNQMEKALKYAKEGLYKIIYVAPERLVSSDFLDFATSVNISMVTVDEAHCISQWGQDFRPSYLRISEFIEMLPQRPIVSAFTATATEEVKEDIVCSLRLQNPKVLVTGFDRPNLYFSVEHTRLKDEYVLDFLREHSSDSGIIYCATRKNVDKLYDLLASLGFSVDKYHAGMTTEDRKQNQTEFIYDRKSVIIATNAFGMGIDKSNVRFVIHYNMPQSIENYYQEAGRAGRDGEEAQCILLYSPQDVVINKVLIENREPGEYDEETLQTIRQRDMHRLRIMDEYCTGTGCLRNYMLKYFGEDPKEDCNNCSNCREEYIDIDVTEAAKWIINCVYETKGRYGTSVVVSALRGTGRAKKLERIGATDYKSYGTLSEVSENRIKEIIALLIQEGYLIKSEDKYGVLKMGNDINRLRDESVRIVLKTREEKEEYKVKKKNKETKQNELTSLGYELFEVLRRLRMQIAQEMAVPPYIVFSDKSLFDMCRQVPSNMEQMLDISGVGRRKYEKYGELFIQAIQRFVNEHPNAELTYGDFRITEKNSTSKTRYGKKNKKEFFISREEAERYTYSEMAYISEIKEKLNSLRNENLCKTISAKSIFEYLSSQGFVEEIFADGIWQKIPTQKGKDADIVLVEKRSSSGTTYQVLMYPEPIQRMIVMYMIAEDM